MSNEMTAGHCPNCERDVPAVRPRINHVLHLLLSLVTCGFWLIVWLLVSEMRVGGWHCSTCGSDKVLVGISGGRASSKAKREDRRMAILLKRAAERSPPVGHLPMSQHEINVLTIFAAVAAIFAALVYHAIG